MINGPGNPQKATTAAELERNKEAVRRIMDDYFTKGDNSFLADIIDADYIQHHPRGADGLGFFGSLVERVGGQIPNKIHALIAQGDLVYAHMHYPGWNTAAVDIFRFNDAGKIIEHWDVLQQIPAEMPHDNGAF